MVGYYLGIRVVVDDRIKDGWVHCLWPDGKTWNHWHVQVKATPWGQEPAV